jgi:hypothetical protein
MARWAWMLLLASSGGEITAMPKLPGDTAMMPADAKFGRQSGDRATCRIVVEPGGGHDREHGGTLLALITCF